MKPASFPSEIEGPDNCPSDLQAWIDVHARLNQVLGLVQHLDKVGHGAGQADLEEIGQGLLDINVIVTNVIGQVT